MPAPTFFCRYLDNDALTQFDLPVEKQAQLRKAQRPILASPEPKPTDSSKIVYTTPSFQQSQSTSDMYLDMGDCRGQSVLLPTRDPIGVPPVPKSRALMLYTSHHCLRLRSILTFSLSPATCVDT